MIFRVVVAGVWDERPAMPDPDRIKVLFVCMGNICRSPLAEGLFLHKINHRGLAHRFMVDSCGTGKWHVGARPDPRILELGQCHGIALPSRARQVRISDFKSFDHILCMDDENRMDVLDLGAPESKVMLMLDCDPEQSLREVPDPYYGGEDGFHQIFTMLDAATEALIDTLLEYTT